MTLEEKLKKIKAGDTVKLRCGGEIVVYELEPNRILINGHFWNKDGYQLNFKETPFDIIDVIPAPFDWDTVEQGMAFIKDNQPLSVRIFECWSIYKNSNGEKIGLFTSPNKWNDQFADREHPSTLTRAPEHDL